MSIKKDAQTAHANLLEKTDPEALERINHFAFDEVQADVDLPDRTKMLSTLAYLLGMQGVDEYKVMLPVALDNGVSPVEAKEVLYQAVDYLGLGRLFPFLMPPHLFFYLFAKSSSVNASEIALPGETIGQTFSSLSI